MNLPRDGDRVALGLEVLAQDDELVPTGPGQRAAPAPVLLQGQEAGQALGGQRQQPVAVTVVQRIIGRLEVIDVHEQGAHEAPAGPGPLQGVAGPLAHPPPLGRLRLIGPECPEPKLEGPRDPSQQGRLIGSKGGAMAPGHDQPVGRASVQRGGDDVNWADARQRGVIEAADGSVDQHRLRAGRRGQLAARGQDAVGDQRGEVGLEDPPGRVQGNLPRPGLGLACAQLGEQCDQRARGILTRGVLTRGRGKRGEAGVGGQAGDLWGSQRAWAGGRPVAYRQGGAVASVGTFRVMTPAGLRPLASRS